MRHPGLKIVAAWCALVTATTLFPPTNHGYQFLFSIQDGRVEGRIYWGRLIAEWIVGIGGMCAFSLFFPSLKQPLRKTLLWVASFRAADLWIPCLPAAIGIGFIALIIVLAKSGSPPPSTMKSTSNWIAVASTALSEKRAIAPDPARRGKLYGIKGKVIAVNPDKDKPTVKLDYEDIPGHMAAMEMTFAMKGAKLLEGIQVGDRVEGKLEARDTGDVIIELRKR